MIVHSNRAGEPRRQGDGDCQRKRRRTDMEQSGTMIMEDQNAKGTETIKMVDRALAVLDVLRVERKRLGVNEIAKKCDISPSTA